MSHYQERMESDLRIIRTRIWNLGEAVEHSLHNAKKILILRDTELAYETVLDDHPINRESREIDRLCHTFIARHLPGAGPLREIAATSRVNVTLERVGDYAVSICREALQITTPLTPALSNYIDAIFDESISILSDARKSFMNGNADMAITLMSVARRVQNKMGGVYETLFAEDDRMDGANMMAVFVIFNMLKRVADQAKNICDQTVYAVRGKPEQEVRRDRFQLDYFEIINEMSGAQAFRTRSEWNAVRQAAGKPTQLEPLSGVAD